LEAEKKQLVQKRIDFRFHVQRSSARWRTWQALLSFIVSISLSAKYQPG
jgi:hypothetical protein